MSTPVRVLGLDLSYSRTGVSLWNGEVPALSTYSTPKRLNTLDRARKIRNKIRQILNKEKPDLVAIEHPVWGKESSAILHGLYYLVMDAIRSKNVPVVSFFNTTLKRLVGGDAGKSKAAMVKAAKKCLGYDLKMVHDEADAFFLSYFGYRFWHVFQLGTPKETLSEAELEAFFSEETNASGMKKGMIFRRGECLFLP